MLIKNNEYTYAKEYHEFYKKYKGFKGLLSSEFVNYDEFVEKHKENYFIFENNYELIKETNNFLSNKNKTFSIELNKYADIIDFKNNEKCDDLNYK